MSRGKVDRPRARAAPKRKPVATYDVKAGSTGGEYVRLSREQTRKLEAQRRLDAANAAAADGETERARASAENRPTAAAMGTRGDGVFRISFVKMGQGDCTIMCTPQGQVILIDCGTNNDDGEGETAYDRRVRGELESLSYLRNTKKIDLVILSHADKDHYNQLETMLPDDYSALTIYHSAEIGHYGNGGTWAHNHVLHRTLIKKVVLDKDGTTRGEGTLAGNPIPLISGPDRREKLDATGGLVIASEPNCEITLLAAGVSYAYVPDSDAIDKRNRGSVVTLVDVFGKKILISADATRATEAFLVKDAGRKARLTGVDIVQAGHHGSDVTSSAKTWVDTLQPRQRVIISAGKVGVPNHHLPSAAVVARYVKRFETNPRAADPTSHQVSAYAVQAETPTDYDVHQPVYATGTTGTEIITIP